MGFSGQPPGENKKKSRGQDCMCRLGPTYTYLPTAYLRPTTTYRGADMACFGLGKMIGVSFTSRANFSLMGGGYLQRVEFVPQKGMGPAQVLFEGKSRRLEKDHLLTPHRFLH